MCILDENTEGAHEVLGDWVVIPQVDVVQGYAGCNNSKIKVLKRNACGFRNYHHFRNRILLITKMFGPKQKGIKQQLVA